MAFNKSEELLSIWGPWYGENIYYKHKLHTLPRSQRLAVRLLLLPIALAMKANRRLRRLFELPSVEMPITTLCTLRCKDCSNLIPFYKNPANIAVSQIISDIDDFMSNVDRVYRFVIMGGEIFLHPDLQSILIKLIQHPKINIVHLVTNATIIPDEDILKMLQNQKVHVTISSYPSEVARNKTELIAALAQKQISYTFGDTMWIDRGGFDPMVDNSPIALRNRFANCSCKRCHNLIDGEYHLCPRSGHGQLLGQIPINQADSVSFRGQHDPRNFQNKLRQLLQKEYITACTKCNGDSGDSIYPAIQLENNQGAPK